MAITPLQYPEVAQANLPKMFQAGLEAQVTDEQLKRARAELPGVEADVAAKQRAAKFNQWLTENAPKFSIPDPARPGQMKLDATAFTNAASLAGYHPEAQGVAIKDFQLAADQAKVSGDRLKLVDTTKTHMANLIGGLPENMRAGEWNKYVNFLKQSGEDQLASMMGEYSPEKVTALKQATLTPKEQDERAERHEKEEYTPGKGGQGDPTTPLAKLAQDAYIKANPGIDEAGVRKLGVFGIKQLPDGEASIAAARESSTISAPQQLAYEATANELTAAQSNLNRGADAVRDLLKNPLYGKTYIGEKLGTLFTKYGKTDPKLKQLQDTIQEFEKVTNKKIDLETSIEGVERVLRDNAKELTPRINTAKRGTGPRVKSAVEGSPSNPAAERVQIMNKHTGDIKTYPADRVQDAIDTGNWSLYTPGDK